MSTGLSGSVLLFVYESLKDHHNSSKTTTDPYDTPEYVPTVRSMDRINQNEQDKVQAVIKNATQFKEADLLGKLKPFFPEKTQDEIQYQADDLAEFFELYLVRIGIEAKIETLNQYFPFPKLAERRPRVLKQHQMRIY